MNFQKNLEELKIAINKELEHQFNLAIANARKKDILMADVLKNAKKIALAGGKRIRGALLYWAYIGVGGKEKKKILKVSAAIEMVHLFLLIHDDIMDRGETRHGEKTLHRAFSSKKQKYGLKNDEDHFGESMAIIAGDMLYVIANKIILEAGFDPKISMQSVLKLQSIIENTIIGQSQDLSIAYKKNATEKEVMEMLKNKTAKYTIEGPVHLGAILGGCNDKRTLDILSQYAIPVGIAFQIQDDILGVFGDKKKIGKSVASDIKEGKQSIMVIKARRLATKQKRKKLDAILGKGNITKEEVKIFQDILKSTGVLEYSRKMAEQYLKKGKREIKKTILLPDAKIFFAGLAEYLENREV